MSWFEQTGATKVNGKDKQNVSPVQLAIFLTKEMHGSHTHQTRQAGLCVSSFNIFKVAVSSFCGSVGFIL
jgi:hypothetical protein